MHYAAYTVLDVYIKSQNSFESSSSNYCVYALPTDCILDSVCVHFIVYSNSVCVANESISSDVGPGWDNIVVQENQLLAWFKQRLGETQNVIPAVNCKSKLETTQEVDTVTVAKCRNSL